MQIASYMLLILSLNLAAQSIWSSNQSLPGQKKCVTPAKCFSDGNRSNIFKQEAPLLESSIQRGSVHALHYPVSVSELQIPYQTMLNFFNSEANSPIRNFVYRIARETTQFKTLEDIYRFVGLNQFPTSLQRSNPNPIHNPYRRDHSYMGATITGKGKSAKLTFSCAACHSSNLFGVKVMGLSNRFPRANEFFILGKKALSVASAASYKLATGASKEELKVFKKSKNAIRYVDLKKPQALGLDTSLAQVALSLAKRKDDEYASRRRVNSLFPRKNKLKALPADSKPAVWWNVKYKTRFLSDGSVTSGNPIYTNFLWNELGRGTDLKKLETWLQDNQETIKDLTSYVFSAVAPRYNDFFPNAIDIAKAKRGQKLFLKTCSGCHGTYEKGWNTNPTGDYSEQLATTKTWYHTKTINIDVGTDEYRYKGMNYFADDLNRLKISKTIGTVVKAQKGYIPPPLEGIWARWPYFHNNSVPTLYDVLTPDFKRPKTYYSREAIDKNKDFDIVKNGYPAKKNHRKYLFNTQKKGLSNKGHTKMMLNRDGSEKFDHTQKLEIIEFLKTL